MSFGSSSRSRIVFSSSSSVALVVLVIFVLQICICLFPDCKAEATRMLSENGVAAKLKDTINMTTNNNNNKKALPKQDLFHKFFNGSRASSFNETEKGIEESKRRVPSCPDPLHN